MYKKDEITIRQERTGFSKWYHDVSCPIKEAGKSQRGHIAPHLEGSGKAVINQRALHVRRIVNDPVIKWQQKWHRMTMSRLDVSFVCSPCITKLILALECRFDFISPLTCKWRPYDPIWGLLQRFGSWPHREPHSEAASWPPAWTYPDLQSPPAPSASASFSKPWRWTP